MPPCAAGGAEEGAAPSVKFTLLELIIRLLYGKQSEGNAEANSTLCEANSTPVKHNTIPTLRHTHQIVCYHWWPVPVPHTPSSHAPPRMGRTNHHCLPGGATDQWLAHQCQLVLSAIRFLEHCSQLSRLCLPPTVVGSVTPSHLTRNLPSDSLGPSSTLSTQRSHSPACARALLCH